ncbi:hypothetical protein F511_28898 [Dorcoceras hygrometricum]|uniref:Uncharacterized protein n=1 Tax=Dorcoceras hygrometricum TaxID=472368 RepID=A0A2Z7CE82_9LAMI|nr:hypothetical protein F511_28898 [Dorcoceras hygrometricum]
MELCAKEEATSCCRSADGLALMTSSVTSSYSADGLSEQLQESAGCDLLRSVEESDLGKSELEDARASGDTSISSPCWDLLATMRRVVNYHSSWARQRQVELFNASGIRVSGYPAGRGADPARGAPGGG